MYCYLTYTVICVNDLHLVKDSSFMACKSGGDESRLKQPQPINSELSTDVNGSSNCKISMFFIPETVSFIVNFRSLFLSLIDSIAFKQNKRK